MTEPIDLSGREQAWTALRLIGEAIETLRPVGALVSDEAVLRLYGPELIHEAHALCDALVPILTGKAN